MLFFDVVQHVCLADVVTDVCLHFFFFFLQTFEFGDNNKDLLGWKVSFILNSAVCPNGKTTLACNFSRLV